LKELSVNPLEIPGGRLGGAGRLATALQPAHELLVGDVHAVPVGLFAEVELERHHHHTVAAAKLLREIAGAIGDYADSHPHSAEMMYG
jgi:hypothetical protein